ncbi:hypothetical protein JCM3774_004136 [Rhodotorula dairenensis]
MFDAGLATSDTPALQPRDGDGAPYGSSGLPSNQPSTSQLPDSAAPVYSSPYAAAGPPLKPRFGKWGRWIEGRAQQRREEQAELRAAGLVKSSSWSLPGQDRASSPLRRDPSALRRDQEAERTLSRDHLILVTNPNSSPASSAQSRSTSPGAAVMPRRARTSSSASVSAAVQPLTRHVRIERVGERFSTGLPEQPLCGCPLPIGPQASTSRFTLIGTKHGLYALDAQPNAGIALSAASGDSAARHHALWTGLGVHHIETYAETDPYAESPRGLVLALVDGGNGELELRMWNLASIVNLVKWRVYSATSVVLSLEPDSPTHSVSHTRTKSAFGLRSPSSPDKMPSSNKRWSSASTRKPDRFAQSHLNPNGPHHWHASRFRYPAAQEPKGSPDLELGSDSGDSPLTPQSSTSRLSLHGPGRPRSASETSHLELPLEWATASVPLPVPKSAGPILFFRLFRRPRPARRRGHYNSARERVNLDGGFSEDSSDDDNEDEVDGRADPRPPQMGSTTRTSGSRHHLYMFVATSRLIFLYESEPVERRTWHLAKEFFAPSTPRFVHLLRTDKPDGESASATSLPHDLFLLVGTSHHLVFIRLSDSTVSELKIPGLDARQANAPVKRGHSVSSGGVPDSVRRSQSQRHRKASPSFAASLRDLNTRMARLIDGGGDRALPAGLRGIDSDFVKSRVVSDDGHEDLSSADRPHTGGGSGGGTSAHPKWIGCCEVALPGRIADTVQVLLLSHARASYLVALQRGESAAGDSSPILLHTFTWPTAAATPLVRVVAAIAPTGDRAVHLSLVGFTQTGILVSEHLVSSAAILSHVSAAKHDRDRDAALAPATAVVVVRSVPPLAARRPPPSGISAPSLAAPLPTQTHEDPDLSDRAAFDFGRAIGRVCPIADGWTVLEPAAGAAGGMHEDVTGGVPSLPQSQRYQQSEYFWVQGRAEWTLKRLVCETLAPAL